MSKAQALEAPLTRTELLRAYRTMRTIRSFEERVVREFEGGNIPGFVHSYEAQEAIGTAVCMHLGDNDYIGSTHRGHGHSISKGCDVKLMMQELMGRSTGLCRGKGGSMHIADITKGMLGANGIVGGAPPLAVGCGAVGKDAEEPWRIGGIHRRWRLQRGHRVRIIEPRRGAEAAGDLRVREQRLR